MGQVRQQFRMNMHETDEAKVCVRVCTRSHEEGGSLDIKDRAQQQLQPASAQQPLRHDDKWV